jgi:hypothetical protein
MLDFPTVDVLQRPNWYGSPVELGELFILKKNRRTAMCKLRSHQFGWEVRLFIERTRSFRRKSVVRTRKCSLPASSGKPPCSIRAGSDRCEQVPKSQCHPIVRYRILMTPQLRSTSSVWTSSFSMKRVSLQNERRRMKLRILVSLVGAQQQPQCSWPRLHPKQRCLNTLPHTRGEGP